MEAGDAAQVGWELGQVEAVARRAGAHRHRGVAVDAERAEPAVGLALAACVHGAEDGIVGGVRVHAPRPLRVMCAVTRHATARIHERGAIERGGIAAGAEERRKEDGG